MNEIHLAPKIEFPMKVFSIIVLSFLIFIFGSKLSSLINVILTYTVNIYY